MRGILRNIARNRMKNQDYKILNGNRKIEDYKSNSKQAIEFRTYWKLFI